MFQVFLIRSTFLYLCAPIVYTMRRQYSWNTEGQWDYLYRGTGKGGV